jgi:arabinofuranosyltransferase
VLRQTVTQPKLVLLAGGAVVLAVFTWHFSHTQLLVDDAYISFRYAENLSRRAELVYNPGERVEGFSSLLWTLLLAGLDALGAPLPRAAPLLGYLLGASTLAVTYLAARRVLGYGKLASLLVTLLLGLSVSFTFWAGAGLESPLFSLLALSVWAGCFSTLPKRRLGWAALAVIASLLVCTRPEGLLLAAAVPGLLLASRHAPRRAVWWTTLLLGALVTAAVAWRLSYYGSWLPNPYQAKLSPTVAALGRGASYVWDYLWQENVLLLLPLAAFGAKKEPRFWTLVACVAAYAALAVLAGGDGLYRYRLVAHVAPALMLTIGAGLHRACRSGPQWSLTVAFAVLLVAAAPLAERAFFRTHSLREVRSWEERWAAVGQSLARAAPPAATLATNVAGRVPYYSELATLDLLGLTDPVIARQPVTDFGSSYAGHERAAPEYVLERRPQLVYFSVLDGARREAFTRLQWVRMAIRTGALYRYAPLLDAPAFARDYRPAFLQVPGRAPANLFIRVRPHPPELGDRIELENWQP